MLRPHDDVAKKPAKADPAQRVLWQTSHITGSPEPPAPYRMERVFPKLEFKNPLLLVRAPGTDRLFVAEQAGPIYSFKPKEQVAKPDLFIDMSKEIHSWGNNGRVKGVGNVYGLVFHPDFVKNRFCYICYVLDGTKGNEQLPEGSRVSRFRVSETTPPASTLRAKRSFSFLGGGPNAGDLSLWARRLPVHFPGDATDQSSRQIQHRGEDISDLLPRSSRIDVNREDPGRPMPFRPRTIRL